MQRFNIIIDNARIIQAVAKHLMDNSAFYT